MLPPYLSQLMTMAFTSTNEPNITRKNSARSIEKRKEGNKLYGSKGHDADAHLRILSLYTESAALAENGSEELALAFNNRSVLLLHLSKLEECLIDVDRTQRITQSEELKAKLATRKAKCLSLLQGSRAKKSANKEPNLLPEMRPSKVIPCVSELVSLKFDEKYGRCMMANQDIEPGTIVAMERGFAFPMIHKVYLNCSHCLNLAWNGIPCDSCACLIYCSERCKEEAWSQYHDIECTVLPYIKHIHDSSPNKKGFINVMAAVKVFIKFVKDEGLENVIKQACEFEKANNNGSQSTKFFNHCSKFKDIYALSVCQNVLDTATEVIYSVIFDLLVNKSSIFNNFNRDYSSLKSKVIKILHKLTWIIGNNGYAYDYVKHNGDQYAAYAGDKTHYEYNIGVIVTPVCSFLNHSCISNTGRAFTKDNVIFYTLDYIKKGQQLFTSYGPDVEVEASFRKQYLLDGYKFICECAACKENWSVEVYDQQDYSEELLFDVVKELINCDVDKTFIAHLKNNLVDFPASEKNLKLVKRIILKINEHCTGFEAVANKIPLKKYIVRYYNILHGLKLNVPNKC